MHNTALHVLPPHLLPRRRPSISSSHAHCPHTPPHSSNLDALSGCEGHTPSLKKDQKISKFRSVYWTNPLFVGVKSPSLTGHSRLGATERRSVTPPPPSPSEDHYASPLLPSVAELQWGELRRDAFGTCASVAGS
ncbi:hypothetical protein EDB86DRAFT_3101281 [Lactarius hatsudake]|nr:hypothetical protein EDB86DRAFT_3101281 [Lactarius hatsudake]